MSATRRALSATRSQRIFITWQSATLFIAIVVAFLFGWKYLTTGPVILQGMPALIEAYSRTRPVELRLSGGFHAGRFDPEARDAALVDREELETARRRILERAQNNDDLQSKLSYARLVLCEKTSAKAQDPLTTLIGRYPDNPEVQNDMGVYLFEREKIEEAIERFDKAIEIAPAMPEPLFNRAICYRKLHLLDATARDLTRAKAIEKDRGWRDEIDARIEEISVLTEPRQSGEEATLSLEAATNAGDSEGANHILNQSFDSLWRYSLVDLPRRTWKRDTRETRTTRPRCIKRWT